MHLEITSHDSNMSQILLQQTEPISSLFRFMLLLPFLGAVEPEINTYRIGFYKLVISTISYTYIESISMSHTYPQLIYTTNPHI